MSRIETLFSERASKIIQYKKNNLSIPNCPIQLVGEADVTELSSYVQQLPMLSAFPGTSIGFSSMSEFMTKTDINSKSLYDNPVALNINRLIEPVYAKVKKIISEVIKNEVIVIRGVIDTIDNNSCIIPHSDGFVLHKLSFRVHVPLFTTEKSLGVNFDPWNYKPYSWKMNTIGGIYIFNNFEPHTVAMLDSGVRSHLILDVSVANLVENCSISEIKSIYSRGERTTLTFSPNTITHTISNFTLRNNLNHLYANIGPKNSLEEQAEPESVNEMKIWIKDLMNFELENGNIRFI